jgi:hypothetical protein
MLVGFDGQTRIVEAQYEEARIFWNRPGAKDLGEEPGKNWWEGRYKSYYPPNDYIVIPG